MENLTNVTFDEIKVGDTATIKRRVTATEIEALSVITGNVEPFQLKKNDGGPVKLAIDAIGGEALVSGLINRKLPGPGAAIIAQELEFEGSIQAGDELVARVTAHQKRAKGSLIIFDCLVQSDGRALVKGTVTVRAPTKRLEYSDVATPKVILRRTDKYGKLLKKCEAIPPVS